MLSQDNEGDGDKLSKLLAVKLAAATANAASAETKALQSAEAYAKEVRQHAQESNYMLWTTLTREQAKRRENHDRIEMMKGPVRV